MTIVIYQIKREELTFGVKDKSQKPYQSANSYQSKVIVLVALFTG
ncbi:hypothetical protein [Brasilonema sp. UFV-L1]